jgi:hypothetical protein
MYTLIALVRSDGSGNSVAMIETIAEVAPAPPNPWTNRAAISMACESATPHTAEDSVNNAIPTRNTRRRPIRSPTRPASSRKLP